MNIPHWFLRLLRFLRLAKWKPPRIHAVTGEVIDRKPMRIDQLRKMKGWTVADLKQNRVPASENAYDRISHDYFKPDVSLPPAEHALFLHELAERFRVPAHVLADFRGSSLAEAQALVDAYNWRKPSGLSMRDEDLDPR